MKHVIALTAALAGLVVAVRAQEAGDPVKGVAVARQLCAECHAVERGQRPSPDSESPAFETIARTPGMTSIALTAALRTSHRRMPDIILPDGEMRDVVAYILTLKR